MSEKRKPGLPKEIAQKVVQHTAYKAQAQSRRAGEDLRNTADGESTADEYAQERWKLLPKIRRMLPVILPFKLPNCPIKHTGRRFSKGRLKKQ